MSAPNPSDPGESAALTVESAEAMVSAALAAFAAATSGAEDGDQDDAVHSGSSVLGQSPGFGAQHPQRRSVEATADS